MRTIIHIGQHKTGTTSIQHYLQDHRDDLMEAGLYIPDTLLGFNNPSHFLLNVYALEEHRESTAKIKLKEAVDSGFFDTFALRLQADIARHYQLATNAGCRDILWTNEGLYLLNSEAEYRKIRELFKGFSDHILCLCCFRDKESFRDSYRRQLASLNLPLSDDPTSYRYLETDSWLLDYDKKKSLLAAVFDEVLTLSYNSGDMVGDFMESIGHPVSGDTSGLRLNTSSRE